MKRRMIKQKWIILILALITLAAVTVTLAVLLRPQEDDAARWFSAVLDKSRLQAYALYFIRDGERVPFDGEVSLSVTKPGRMTEPRLYRVSPDGMARELPFEVRDGLLSLSAAYEAPYFVVADEAGPGSAPQTGEANFSGWFAAMGAAALTLLLLTKRYAVKKMKEEAQWN